MSDEIWLEKYRPKTLDEVVGNVEIINQLKKISKYYDSEVIFIYQNYIKA
jgi:replication-associated recombination protein RarA